MKKILGYILLVLGILSCQKMVTPVSIPEQPVTPLPPVKESTAGTPFAQRISLQLDNWHADSAFLQLPSDYYAAKNTDKYPLLVFLNGVFEGSKYGNLRKLKRLGPPKYMMDSLRFQFTVNGKTESMIVVCPQSYNGYRPPNSTNQVIDSMIANYRVDVHRIYLTGLSAGACSMLRYLTHKPEYAARIAAAVPMSTTWLDSTHRAQLYYISNAKLPLNWFCGNNDKKYLRSNKNYVKIINDLSPGLVQFRLYKGEHKGWNPMYALSHKYYKPNIYEWMLQYSR